jgi:hypothetical protein
MNALVVDDEAHRYQLHRDVSKLLFKAFKLQNIYINNIPEELVDAAVINILRLTRDYNNNGPENST